MDSIVINFFFLCIKKFGNISTSQSSHLQVEITANRKQTFNVSKYLKQLINVKLSKRTFSFLTFFNSSQYRKVKLMSQIWILEFLYIISSISFVIFLTVNHIL